MVLAAGGSSRFGSPKLLAETGGQPLVGKAAQAAADSGAQPVYVVLGANALAISTALSDDSRFTCLVNPDWDTGLASSLAVGVREVLAATACEGALVTLADQPFVDAAALTSLIAVFDDDHRLVASSYDGTIGVPALFGREFLDEISHLTGDHGAGAWLRSRADDVITIQLEKAALDIDNPSDAALLK